MITGIDRPSDGQVVVTGRDIHAMRENELAKWRGQEVGIIFQFFQMLPSLSLLQNVVLPMEFAKKFNASERRDRAMHLLEIVGLDDQANKLPGMVSGGQQQRAAIARALSTDPPLLVADEPTGNLDTVTAQQVFDLFINLVEEQGKTMLMVTHDQDLAGRIPRKIEIVNGRIANDQHAQSKIEGLNAMEQIPASQYGINNLPADVELNGSYVRNGNGLLVGAYK
jgi:putative ABC transport system ATP-binding protein